MNRRLGILLSLIYLLATSCATIKETSSKRIIFKKKDELLSILNDSSLQYQGLVLKASISFSSSKRKIAFKSQIRIQKDSAIWSSLSMFGIAGAKTLITTDSVKMVNYKDKTFLSEGNEKLTDFFGTNLISFENLQSLLTGNRFNLGPDEKLHVKQVGDHYEISTVSERRSNKEWVDKKHQKMEKKIEKQVEKKGDKKRDRLDRKMERRPDKYNGIEVEYWVDAETFRVQKMTVKDYGYHGQLSVEYSNYEQTVIGFFPMKCKIQMLSDEQVEFNIVYSKVDAEPHVNMPFSIPKKYEKVEM